MFKSLKFCWNRYLAFQTLIQLESCWLYTWKQNQDILPKNNVFIFIFLSCLPTGKNSFIVKKLKQFQHSIYIGTIMSLWENAIIYSECDTFTYVHNCSLYLMHSLYPLNAFPFFVIVRDQCPYMSKDPVNVGLNGFVSPRMF